MFRRRHVNRSEGLPLFEVGRAIPGELQAGDKRARHGGARLEPVRGIVWRERRQKPLKGAPGRMRGEQRADSRQRVGNPPHHRCRVLWIVRRGCRFYQSVGMFEVHETVFWMMRNGLQDRASLP